MPPRWSKAVRDLSKTAGVPRFSTHTLRHLCLTDLARAGWDIHEIAAFAGRRSLASTLLYIHLSGRDPATKLAEGMTQIHAWRSQQTFLLRRVLLRGSFRADSFRSNRRTKGANNASGMGRI